MNDQLERISNIRTFPERLSGRLYARFVLDTNGEPQFETDTDNPNAKHYLIDLYVHSPRAAEIDVVIYHLLDPGFSESELRSEDEPNDFRAAIQTYSDTPVDVTVNIMSVLYRQRTMLSAMLENGHAGSTNPAVRAAIDRIKMLGG